MAIRIVYFLLIALSFSFLGLSIGILIGSSVSPVIGVIIPALLTFFGGFVTYVFIFKGNSLNDGYAVATIISSLSFFLILGADYAASMRVRYEKELRLFDENQKRQFEVFKYNLGKGEKVVEASGINLGPNNASLDSSKKTNFTK